ncbi:hypothetical protein PSQ90_10175 [Devosia rhodophyticola]|uniref:Uncharacterized protein n=1 Tax=Devosia rhodophyticola TaxID=3026423 RepID=A0ABY7YTQ5_9HYPH|nr:hypothetical protein [Devosia rhodophyticola]WDR04691.1 hypothetical protein PSQ90_10175 [Devosia rhodophyticola]
MDTTDLDQDWTLPGVTKSDTGANTPPEQPPARPSLHQTILLLAVGLVGLTAIIACVWVYTDTRREVLRLATEVAQLRLSLDLYVQQKPGTAAVNPDAMLNLQNRLAILEDSWRNQSSPVPAITAPAAVATGTATAQDDCMPQATKFLVSSGDSYPLCNTTGVISVLTVSPDRVSFTDGTVIPAGGNGLLSGTNCRITVLSSEADGLSGYAELRASC